MEKVMSSGFTPAACMLLKTSIALSKRPPRSHLQGGGKVTTAAHRAMQGQIALCDCCA